MRLSFRRLPAALLLAGALAAPGCERRPQAPPADAGAQSSGGAPAPPVVPGGADTAALAGDSIVYDRERGYDLTGDAIPEIVRLHATGKRWDALGVRLEILSGDSVLYADTFDTGRYMGLDPDPRLTPAQVAEAVKNALDEDLSFDAFAQKPDTSEMVDLPGQYARARWAMTHPEPLPQDGDSAALALQSLGITPQEYVRFRDDVLSHPMYRYYLGGETSVGVSWSSVLKRFVRTWNCC